MNEEITIEPETWELDPAKMVARLDELIKAAPDSPTPEKVESWGSEVSLKGWDARHRKLSEPSGDAWLTMLPEASKAVSQRGLIAFIGDRGTGKTQMAMEIAHEGNWPVDEGKWNGHRKVHDQTALYRRAMDIFLDLRDANKRNSEISEKEVLAKLAEVGLLVIDEFQERGESEWENRVLTNLLDKRYAAERPTIIIANYSRKQLSDALSASVKDRMHENGRAFVFDWQSFRRTPKP